MSNSQTPTSVQPTNRTADSEPDAESGLACAVLFEYSPHEWDRIEQAVDETDADDTADLVREAVRKHVTDVLDEDRYACPRDGCEETFPTEEERRGHLGSSAHALDVPDGDVWCGYCGYGPASWRAINSHHGASPSHDGDVIRLDEEPDEEDLVIDPDQISDHKDQQLLERLYREHDGNIRDLCRAHDFDVHDGTVRNWLIKYDIHEVTRQGTDSDDEDVPDYRDRERLEELYRKNDQSIAGVHRALNREVDEDVPYRTVHNWLIKLDIHDPNPRGTTSTSESEPATESEPANDDEPEVATEDPAETLVDEDDQRDEPADVDEADDPNDEPDEVDEPARDVITVADPADVDSFADLATPDWLDEGTFHAALDMSDSAEEFAENLGWGDPEDLRAMVDLLGVGGGFEGGDEE